MKKVAHCKQTRICAFCQNWYDPCNSAIRPKSGDFFEYENTARNKCMERKVDTGAWSSCGKFKCKF